MTVKEMQKRINSLESELSDLKEFSQYRKEAKKCAKVVKLILDEFKKVGISEEITLEIIKANVKNSN